MTAETRSSRTIFLDALQRVEPEARQEFVDSACGNDASLRAEVQRLLDAHDNLNSFMGQPAAGPTEVFVPPEYEQVGAMVGRYKLLEQVGEGGMGVVYLAEQTEPVRRRVALKIIKPGIDTRQVIARFEAERQALAMMDHPNIAKVLDAGATEAGRPYFVMELVRGLTITEYCDQAHIDTRGRLELFATICQAVQHAHQKGIIHRDIKPSNVLVTLHDGQAVGKVIDFGVAKAINQPLTERTIYTAFSEIVGTPLYMSPEQATLGGLDIDTRSDVYSLGVLLYELLTGQTPFDRDTLVKAGLDEVRRIIREDEPPTPSHRISSLNAEAASAVSRQRGVDQRQLHRVLQNELDWIVMKSLAKERERRYETASAFAKDIERFLNHEPVQAGPPSVRYRLRKFARRNRPQVIAASLVLAALLTGTVGTTLGLIWAIEAEGVAEQRFEETEAARKKAERAEDNTLEAYRESTDDAIEQLIGSKPELGPQEQAYLNKTLDRWQAFATRQGTDERSRAIRGEGHYRVATLWQKLGKYAEALRHYQAARDIETNLVEQFPNVPKYRQSLATTRCSLGLQWRTVGNSKEAIVECRAAHKLQKELVEKFPGEPEYQSDLAITHSDLGMLLAERGDSDAAQVEWRTARGIQKQLVEKFPATLAYQHDLALSHKNLGTTLAFLGNEEAARVEFQAARDIVQMLAQRMPTEPIYQQDLAGAQVSLGNQFARLGKPEAAQAEYEAARTIQQTLVEQFPSVPAYHQNLANIHNNLGGLLSGLGKREVARVEYEAARDIGKLLVQRFHGAPEHQLYLGAARNNLALLLAEMGENANAQAEYQASREIGETLTAQFPAVPAYQKYLADAHNNLGSFFKSLEKTEEALAEYRMACDLSQKLADQFPAVPQYRLDLSLYYRNYATLVCDKGNPMESLKSFDQAVQAVKPLHELAPRDAATREILRDSHWGRALAYEQLKQPTQAIEDWNQTIELSPPEEQLNFEAIRATSMLHAGMVAEAVAQVAELSNDPRWRAEQWYGFACIAAVASGQIADKRQEYADGAMNLLQLAVQAGFKDAKHIAHDTELAAIRDREDFKELVAELEKQ